jgi:hypothetical protein
MEKFEILKFLKMVGFEISLFIAGLFGAFVNLSRIAGLGKWERFTYLCSGAFTAVYITPLFASVLQIEFTIQTMAGMGFVVGYMGFTSIIYFIDYIKQRFNIQDKKNENK